MRRVTTTHRRFVTAFVVLASAVASLAGIATAPASQAAPAAPDPVAMNTVPNPPVDGHAGLYGWGAATMNDGTILISDYWNLRVRRYDTNGDPVGGTSACPGCFIDNPGFEVGKNQAPYGLAVDPADGAVYMADTDRYRINKYDSNGNFLLSWGTQGVPAASTPHRFQYPSRVAVAPDGTVWVADTWSNVLVHDRINPDKSVTQLGIVGATGSKLGQFKQPHGMQFDAQGRLWIVDTGNHRVQVFTPSSNTFVAFGKQGAPGTCTTSPPLFAGDMRGLAVDKTHGFAYVVDAEGDKVHKFDMNFTPLGCAGSNGTGDGQFSDGGREATVDNDGNLWVGDMPNFRVQKFWEDEQPGHTTNAYALQVPKVPAPPAPGGFNAPRGVAVDAAGNLFVVDTYNQRIQKFSPSATQTDPTQPGYYEFATQWGSRGRDDYAFNYARLIAVDPRAASADPCAGQSVVMVDTDNHRVKRYTNAGVFCGEVGGSGTAPLQFKNPHGVDVGPDGKIYVADSNNKRVQVLNANFTIATKSGGGNLIFGSAGTGNGQFKFPRGIAVDPDGTIWVADSGRNNVAHFDSNGTYLGQFGATGFNDNQLNNPFDVESDGTYLYVADTANNKVKIWQRSGAGATFVAAMGTAGQGAGQMMQPNGLDLDNAGHLFVAEQDNDRIQMWSLNGNITPPPPPPPPPPGAPDHVGTIGGPGHAAMYPSGLEVGPDGSVVIADTGNNVVRKFNPAGANPSVPLWTSAGSTAPGAVLLNNPRDVGIDSANNVYVADTVNARIVKFDANGNYVKFWTGATGDKIGSPIGISVSGNQVYVADASKLKVRVFDTNGNQIRAFGSSGACTLAPLRDVDADVDGNVYVANYTKNNIVKFSSTGACIKTWGVKGAGNGQFMNPYGLRVFSDPVLGAQAVYVADSNNGRIQEFTKDGAFVAAVGTAGDYNVPNTFSTLRRVAVASNGDVWGADLWGYRIERFARTASGFNTIAAQTIPTPIAPPPLTATNVFNEPRGVGVSTNGDTFVADTVNQRFVHFNSAGAIVNACGTRGEDVNSFNWPRGVAVDQASPGQDVWVADTKQSRLQVINPSDCSIKTLIGTLGSGTTNFNWPYSIAIRGSDRTAWVADTLNNRILSYNVATRAVIATYAGPSGAVFNNPRGIGVNLANGNILVADSKNNRVLELTTSGGNVTGVARTLTGFKVPEGVAGDAAGRVYVADTGNNRVVVVGTDSAVLGTLDALSAPQNVTVDTNGRILVSDTGHDKVEVYSYGTPPPPPPPPTGLHYDSTLAGPGKADMYPVDATEFGSNYYVLDAGNYRIVQVDRTTGALGKQAGGTQGRDPGKIGDARAIDHDSLGNIYVADTPSNRIEKWTSDLNFVSTWGTKGTGNGQFTQAYGVGVGPGKLANGAAGEVVYAVDGAGRVEKFTTDGTYISSFGMGDLNQPRQVTVDPATKQVYVLSARDHQVVVYSVDGAKLFVFGNRQSDPGFTGDPRGISINGTHVYLTDEGQDRIEVFDTNGTYRSVFGGVGACTMENPRGLTATSDNKLLVTDEWGFGVDQFDVTNPASPTCSHAWFGHAAPVGGFNSPRGLAVDPATGRVFAVDWWNQRIQRFGGDGSNPVSWGFRGTSAEPGSVNFAWDAAFRNGRIFLANRESHEIEVFTTDGAYVTRWGTRGTNDGQLQFPQGVAFDPTDGSLLVSDSGNNRIERFAIDSNGNGTWLATYGSAGDATSTAGHFNVPTGIDVASDGTIWVADTINNRVQKRAANGTWTAITSPTVDQANHFRLPWGVDIGPDGHVWVSDSGNDRIVKMSTAGVQDFAMTGPDLGTTPFNSPFSIAFGKNGEVYVSDTWNNRVVTLKN
jgi:DNA-binding beta-propeller fold protein YncE